LCYNDHNKKVLDAYQPTVRGISGDNNEPKMTIQKSQEMTILMIHVPQHISKPPINTQINTNDSSIKLVWVKGRGGGVTIFRLATELLENSC
jgi:hypothetical protein